MSQGEEARFESDVQSQEGDGDDPFIGKLYGKWKLLKRIGIGGVGFVYYAKNQEDGRIAALLRRGQAPLRYARADGALAEDFPDNPNGSDHAVAAMCNRRGNVLALMPHPERAQDLGVLPPSIAGMWGKAREKASDDPARRGARLDGPGLELFKGLKTYLEGA